MNKYVIPICDISSGNIWTHTISAKSRFDCQDKLMEELTDMYEIEDCDNYRDFVEVADSKYDILIGDIKDLEEL
jgi:hypothetical protein